MNRPDKVYGINYQPAEKEIGGIPNSSHKILMQAHASQLLRQLYRKLMLDYEAIMINMVMYVFPKNIRRLGKI